jgi:hypothetical protein
MERDDAFELLPPMYAVALRLADTDAAPDVIATAAGIEIESVPAFVELARAKLDQLVRR